MHGIGNDYIFVDCFDAPFKWNPAQAAKYLSREHISVGSDGLILIEPCDGADGRMRIFNKDGSEGEMCGNGLRCTAKYLYESGRAKNTTINIMTGNGIRQTWVFAQNGKVTSVRADMGEPVLESARIPVNAKTNIVTLDYDGGSAEFFCVNVGNPHAVTFDIFPEGERFAILGEYFEHHPVFPNRANISFCRVDTPSRLTARIWERGSGATRACGSGATATFAAAYFTGHCQGSATVSLPGGDLLIEYADGRLYMTGPCQTAFTGSVDLDDIDLDDIDLKTDAGEKQ